MTVAELITLLQACPPDARVVVDGYEGGYDEPRVRGDVMTPDQISGYEGEHAEAGLWKKRLPRTTIPVVVVSRDDINDTENELPDYAAAVTALRARGWEI